ncbi:hypothetical protein QTP70_003892 [Hemibagrus guttatus]|uniref:Tc1-like transposase DDE domain-containing protein n=1 Tax=Hemibagrus guttatus TaxID=175788 RepID=A0AAE0UUD6_9TELE|nr:hypothetical protein QTP70_003892 [Hemibagrus guttatus]
MGPHSRRPVRVSMLTPVHCRKRQQWAREHQNWTTEQWKKVAWSDESRFLLHPVDGRVHVRVLPGEHMTPGCTMGRRRAGGGSVLLWAMFCWETLGPAIHVDVTLTRSTYLSIVADHVHPFMETLFPDGCGLFQQDNALCHKAEMVQEWFDDHNNQFEVLTPPPNSPDLNPIQHLWDVLDKQVPSMEALKDLTYWCQILQHTFRDLVESMPRQKKMTPEANPSTQLTATTNSTSVDVEQGSDDQHLRVRDYRKLAICSIICGLSCVGIVSLIYSVKSEGNQNKRIFDGKTSHLERDASPEQPEYRKTL